MYTPHIGIQCGNCLCHLHAPAMTGRWVERLCDRDLLISRRLESANEASKSFEQNDIQKRRRKIQTLNGLHYTMPVTCFNDNRAAQPNKRLWLGRRLEHIGQTDFPLILR
eukprot:scpid48635/ scgid7443/ 